METFWNTIAQYNESTWWAQILITAAGILLTALLYRRPTVWTKRSMKIYMVFLNGWIALVYYAMYCDTRNYHYVLSAFWGTVALIWLWDLFTGYTPFERNPKYPMLAGVLYAMPFLYPLLSWARGMEFPMMTTTVMPCSMKSRSTPTVRRLRPAILPTRWPGSARRKAVHCCCWQAPPYLPSTCSSRIT